MNDVREMKFNAIGQCISPLVQTESSINHYPGTHLYIQGIKLKQRLQLLKITRH